MSVHPSTPLRHIPLDKQLTYRMSRTQAKLNAQASRLLKECSGLSLTQWRILVLLDTGRTNSVSAMARDATFDKGQLSRNLKSMAELGLVRVTQDENDHRRQLITLTEKGQKTYETAMPHMRARQMFLLNCLSADEREMIFSALEKLEAAAALEEFPQ